MTTLWARALIISAWKEDKITKDCAMYFDELLNTHRFFNKKGAVLNGFFFVSNEKVEYPEFNVNSLYCTLGDIGRSGNRGFDFNVMQYLKAVTYPKGTSTGDTAYMSEIIGEEYSNLTLKIDEFIKNENPCEEDLLFIQKYIQAKSPSKTYTYLLDEIEKKLNKTEKLEV